MSENLDFYKGLESNLPKSGIVIGALYHCTDTKNTYIGVSTTKMELWANGAIKRHTATKEDGTQIIAGAGTETTVASGALSFAEGNLTNALGKGSHAEGEETYAFGRGAHAEGCYYFDPINWRLSTTDPERKVWTYGQLGTAAVDDYIKHENVYLKIVSIDTSTKTITLSDSVPGNSINEVLFYYYGKIGAYGDYSHAEGENTNAIGPYSHAEGWQSEAMGKASHAEGHNSKATGQYSHAEGISTIASGHTSHTEGTLTEAGNSDSHAEGWGRHAFGMSSHAEGEQDTPVAWRIKEPDSNKKIWKYDSLGSAVIGDLIRYEDRIYKIEQIDEENKTIALSRSIDTTTTNITVQFFGKQGAFGWASHAEGLHTGALGDGCHAEGNFTVADSYYTHAEGTETKAESPAAHAEGARTTAHGNSSHAEGSDTLAYGVASHAEGDESKAMGNHSHAEGFATQSNGEDSHAEGYSTIAQGLNSHAENNRTQAVGENSHAEGIQTKAIGKASHAEGILTLATGENSHAEGYYTNAQGLQSHTEGQGQRTELLKVDTTDEVKKYQYYGGDEYLFVEVGNTVSSNVSGVTTTVASIDLENKFIYTTNDLFPAPFETQKETLIQVALFDGIASGEGAHSEGYCTTASARGAHSEGGQTKASADRSHAEGGQTTASGLNAHAEGWKTLASANDSHAEGNKTKATALYSHAEGIHTKAKGEASHAEGGSTEAKGWYSHAEGQLTKANKSSSHAEGSYTTADGFASHAEGYSTQATADYQHVQGKYNKTVDDAAFIVGNGSYFTPSNAHVLDWDGNAHYAGNVYVNSNDAACIGGDIVATQNELNGKLSLEGGQLEGSLTTQGIILTQGYDYGDATPTEMTQQGRLYFVEDNSFYDIRSCAKSNAMNIQAARIISINDFPILLQLIYTNTTIAAGTTLFTIPNAKFKLNIPSVWNIQSKNKLSLSQKADGTINIVATDAQSQTSSNAPNVYNFPLY